MHLCILYSENGEILVKKQVFPTSFACVGCNKTYG